jgi:putative two-component system response regulator
MNRLSTETITRESLEFVRRMAWLAEYRKPHIKNHLERIRGYCSVIGRGISLTTQEVEIISQASQLHDIGEAGVPEAILTKSGDLTDMEWEMIKRHPIIGAEILHGSSSPILQAGEIIALTHHERWDGSGYPYGVKGEDIPLSGRICAIADVFDALTTPRVYKKEISTNDAMRLIADAGGHLFDPKLVEIFVHNIDEILRIRQNNLPG